MANKRRYINHVTRERECITCHKIKPFSEFSMNKHHNAPNSLCKKCAAEAARIRRGSPPSDRCYINYEQEERQCAKCHKIKSFLEYTIDNYHGRPLSRCKNCMAEDQRERKKKQKQEELIFKGLMSCTNLKTI